MEAWDRVQGPARGNAEGEELVHEEHEQHRSFLLAHKNNTNYFVFG